MAKLVLKFKGVVRQEYPLDNPIVIIGRSPTHGIFIDNLAVSRNHARITHSEDHYTIEDLNSRNGTYVNGIGIESRDLKNGDLIRIGKHVLEFFAKGEAVMIEGTSEPNIEDYSSEMVGTFRIKIPT
ncbi:hypothetical protein CCP4SC76_6900007 [Gammaproteobacteria bacterium]